MGLEKRIFAAWYDWLNAGVEPRLSPYRQQTAGKAWGRVLEIGGGTGANLAFYPKEVEPVFLEPNPHMTRRLLRKARRMGRQVRVVAGYGEALPFPDASFDTVVTTLVLCMVRDLDRVIAETRRVLRPGGVFLFYEHVVARSEAMRRLQDRLNPLWRSVTTGCNLNRDIAGAIRRAGFREVNVFDFYLPVAGVVRLPNIIGAARA